MERKNLNAKVISIHEHKLRYNEVWKEVLEELPQVNSMLFSSAINLLVSHKWKAWSESLPYGAEFQFEESAMRDAGDEFVIELLDLRASIEEFIAKHQI